MSEITKSSFKPSIHRHESFVLRRGWLHKGLRNVMKEPKLFSNSNINPCDILGVGTNMVKSLRYWLKATQMITDVNGIQKITDYAEIILKYDPYFEERGTKYLIHYFLASNKESATTWWWFFNIHKGKTIDKEQFLSDYSEYLKIYTNTTLSRKVLESEFSTLIRTYCSKEEIEDDPEETKICPLSELRLISLIKQERGKKIYKKNVPDKDDIHPLIAFSIICNKQAELNSNEIQISELLNGENNIGRIFNLDRTTVFYLIERMEKLDLIKIVRTAGLDVIRIKKEMRFKEGMKEYYKNLFGEANNE